MFAGVKLLLPVIGLTPLTDKVAVALEVEPPMLLDTLAVGIVLTYVAGAGEGVATTCTVIVHWPAVPPDCAATEPPLNVTVVVPGVAVTDPPQLFDSRPPDAMVRPVGDVGKLSVKLTDVAGVAVLLKSWIVSVDVPAGGIFAGEKDLLTSNCACAAIGRKNAKSRPTASCRTIRNKIAFPCIFERHYHMLAESKQD